MNKFKETFWELLKLAALVAIIVIPIRTYVAQPFIVSGGSMLPTFNPGEYLIIDELSYLLRLPARGEVIVFRYPENPKKFFIKRIIALPGETVTVTKTGVHITTTNGEKISYPETYLAENMRSDWSPTPTTLGDDEYFVLGDNRPVSLDSRAWGAVSRDLIKGRAFVRLLPITKLDYLPGHADLEVSVK